MAIKKVKFTQIAVGQYRVKDGPLSFIPLALGTDGKVYKFLLDEGWITLEDSAEQYKQRQEDANDGEDYSWEEF